MVPLKSLLSAGCVLCLLLSGCSQPSQTPSPGTAASDSANTSSQPTSTPGVGNVIGGDDFAPIPGDAVDEEARGKLRITYNGNESSVHYITSVDQLPAYEELKEYDEDYFQDHALVVVTESVSSGSVDVEIDSIRQTDTGNQVVLYHSAPGDDQAGTADMATWLLWAEVDAGIEGTWTVSNPALSSDAVKY